MSVEVRERRDADLAALAEVLVRVHEQDGYPVEGVADPVAWLTPPRQIAAWTALHDDKPIGQATLTEAAADDDAARVWLERTQGDLDSLAIPARLFVDPGQRQHGAGGALMTAIRDHATRHGLTLAFDVMLKDQAAIRLYEAAGCARIGAIEHAHSDGRLEPAAVYVMPSP